MTVTVALDRVDATHANVITVVYRLKFIGFIIDGLDCCFLGG